MSIPNDRDTTDAGDPVSENGLSRREFGWLLAGTSGVGLLALAGCAKRRERFDPDIAGGTHARTILVANCASPLSWNKIEVKPTGRLSIAAPLFKEMLELWCTSEMREAVEEKVILHPNGPDDADITDLQNRCFFGGTGPFPSGGLSNMSGC